MTKRINKIFVVSIAVIAAVMVLLPLSSCNDSSSTLDKYFNATWNRGGSTERTENSLYAYANAIKSGATCIQADMQMTKDGVIVLNHDPFLNSAYVYDSNGKLVKEKSVDIRTITSEELEKYHIGPVDKNSSYYATKGAPEKELKTKIPTLEDLLQLVITSGNKDVVLSLEVKLYCDPSTGDYYKNNVDKNVFIENLYNTLKKHNMQKRVIISSYDWSVFPILNNYDNNIEMAAIWRITPSEDIGIGNLWYTREEESPWLNGNNIHEFNDEIISIAFALGCRYVFPEKESYTIEQIDQAHDWEMKVIPWSLNTEEEMEFAWNLGVDGIMSDDGKLLRSFLEEHGAELLDPYQFKSEYLLD